MSIEKLDQTFVKGAVLKADELNTMVDKINELVAGQVVIGTTAGTAYDGASGATLEQLVRELTGASGTMYSVYVKNNLDTLSFSAQYGSACTLDFTFVSQYRDDISDPYKQTGELGMCTIMIKNSKYTDFTVIKQMEISSGVSVTVDVSDWLTSGSNSVKVSVKGENTEKETSPLTYTVQLTSLGVSAPNFAWYTAYSSAFNVPMIISGNISKILHVEVSGEGYATSFEKNLGLSVYTDTPYLFEVEHPGSTGVYTIRFWLTNADGTITTKAVSYNFMMLAKAGEDATLLCVNNLADSLTNWQDNTVLEYAIYNGQSATAAVEFEIYKDNSKVYTQSFSSIETGTKNTLTYPMEIDTDDDTDFSVVVVASSGGMQLLTPTEIQVNNSLGFSATSGAVFYLNPKTRYNAQDNYLSVLNEVTGENVPVAWTSMNWGNDGWVTDDNGVKALKIFAKSRAVIDYTPYATECARTGKTVELDFMVDNASSTSEDIIRIASETNDGRVGLTVSGENVSFNSQSRQDSTTQDVPLDNGVRIRLTVVVMPDAYGNSGFNLVCIYINGKKNRQYAYESNDYFKNEGKIELGNDVANLYLYSMRIYDKALASDAVQKNYINLLADIDEKQAESDANEVLDVEGSSVDFDNCKTLYNVFVCDAVFPSFTNPSGVKCNMEVYFHDRPHNNFTLTNLLMEGQGTSSKKYYEWNERWKFGSNKDASGAKLATIATYADGTTDKNKVYFAAGVPKSGRLTAKKNWASSMQDHKAGAVGAYTDLFREMGLSNEAMELDSDVRISVYQEPFIGFSKVLNEEGKYVYTCMGEFTLGPDKGDKLCFGFDTDKFPNLIAVEGSDNAPLGALFRVPWNPTNRYWAYNADEEAYQYNDTNCWDYGAGLLDSSSEPIETARWREAYNAVYVCSNRIKPFNGTLTELNNQVSELRGSGYEYWIAKSGDANQYNLYYFEAADGLFKPSDIGEGTINLKTQLAAYLSSDLSAFSADELNTMFINARAQLFRDTITDYFDIDDACFHYVFTEFIAGTDNRAKNTYPYNFGTSSSKWRWRQDDLDTIFPIDNQGQDRKPYYVEMHDSYSNGQPMWNGETSIFWNLLENAFSDEINKSMKNMLSAMESLSGKTTGTPYDKVYAFYVKYFVDVKEYFPATIVNADAKRYEVAKLAYNSGEYTNDTDPITQSHGDFYSAETAWVKKRVMYIMSKYSYGLFSADGTDSIIVRAAGDLINYDITPAYTMYPAIANGTSIVRGERTNAGDTLRMTIDLGGSADQQNIIEGASWLKSIGDWHDKNVSGTMVVRGKRLTELLLGSKTETPVISITGLTLSDCGSMQNILLSNISTLQGTLDVSACANIQTIYADGTGLSQIKLPSGGGLQYIEYPAANKYISLKDFAVLKASGVVIGNCAANVTDFFVVNCPLLNPIDLLYTILTAQSGQSDHSLKRIRAVGFDVEYDKAGLDKMDSLVQLVDGTYEGLDSDGYAGSEEIPVIDGTVTIKANVYEDTIESLQSKFTRLNIVVNGSYYIRFEDSAVLSIVLANWGDGTGITKAQAAAVTDIAQKFRANTNIKKFNELKYFGVTSLTNGNFYQCTNLEEIDLTIIEKISSQAFSYCSALKVVNAPNLKSLRDGSFRYCTGIEQVESLGEIEELESATNWNGTSYYGTFMQCTSLKHVKLPSTIRTIGGASFQNCTSLEVIEGTEYATYIGGSCFENTKLSVLNIDACISAGNYIVHNCKAEVIYARSFVEITGSYTNSNNCQSPFCGFRAQTYYKRIYLRDIESISDGAFSWGKNFEALIIENSTPPTIGSKAFADAKMPYVYVPDDAVATYKAHSDWSAFASYIKPMSELVE